MNSRNIEILVGFFVLLFLAAMLVLALRVSNLGNLGSGAGYTLNATFDNIGGLKVQAPVSAGGVKIGRVTSINYNSKTHEAEVSMMIQPQFDRFPTDTSASIYTAGLLGEQYIGLEPGAEIDMLVDNDEIELTQSALVLERLIGQVLFNRSGSN